MSDIFLSHFRRDITALIQQKQASGFQYLSQKYWLKQFDFFCHQNYTQGKELTKELAFHWAEKRHHESVKTLECRVVVVRQLAKFMNRNGIHAYVIPPGIPGKYQRYLPHIFTEIELATFFKSIDSLPPKKHYPGRHITVPVMFRVLYCCGLRSSELLSLAVDHVDLSSGKLMILNSKGNKDRNVMMSPDLLKVCLHYHEKISLIYPHRHFFFPNQNGSMYGKSFLRNIFRNQWEKINASSTNQCNIPRVHDFRHTFAVKRLNQWVQEGKNLQAYLPYLSMYMGHSDLSETDYYLRLVPEFFPIISQLGESRFSTLIPEVTYEL